MSEPRETALKPYGNRSGQSGVTRYRCGATWIEVEFGGWLYRYDWRRPGRRHVEEMQRLAEAGRGLSTYISQQVRERYAAKLRSRYRAAPTSLTRSLRSHPLPRERV